MAVRPPDHRRERFPRRPPSLTEVPDAHGGCSHLASTFDGLQTEGFRYRLINSITMLMSLWKSLPPLTLHAFKSSKLSIDLGIWLRGGNDAPSKRTGSMGTPTSVAVSNSLYNSNSEGHLGAAFAAANRVSRLSLDALRSLRARYATAFLNALKRRMLAFYD